MEPLMGLPLAMLFSAGVFPMLPETHGTVGGFRATLRITPLDKYFSELVQPNSLSSFKVTSGVYHEKLKP